MPWDLLIFPFLGGYWFIIIYYPTRFRALQLSSQRLMFHSATMAIYIALIAKVIASFVADTSPEFVAIFHKVFPLDYFGTAFLAFLLGPLIAGSLNLITNPSKANIKQIEKYGDPLEQTLLRATESDELVIFSMSSGKVYVGLIVEIPANLDGPLKWITMVPYFSGFRDPVTKGVKLTTSYWEVLYKSFDGADENANVGVDLFSRVIKVEDVVLCGLFDLDVWELFQGTPEEYQGAFDFTGTQKKY